MRKHYPAVFAAALVALAAARAWTCDDAFITFRVVEQLLAGAGPVFNAGERVQVFTHPLWLIVLAGWRAMGFSLFPGAMILSVALFAAGAGFLYVAFRSRPAAIAVAFTAMLLCRPVVDFASGGLETPATFLLLAAAVWSLRGARPALASGLLALLPLNRLDLLPFALPFVALALAGASRRERLARLAVFVAPALAWMAFSTVYYGSPIPNTAAAKLGAPLADRLDRGLAYVAASFTNDAGSLALLFLAPALAAWQWRRGALEAADRRMAGACAAAAAMGLAYAIWAGGDFMLGRFVLPTLWALALLLLVAFPAPATPVPLQRRVAAACLAVLAAATLVTGQTSAMLWLDLEEASYLRAVGFSGATDERRVYLPWLGAYASRHPSAHPHAPVAGVQVVLMLGQNGYFAPSSERFADISALADPFMARVAPLPHGRPGHEFRPAPEGWWLWREASHRFPDARLDAFAADLRRVHLSAELWSAARWAAMWRVATFGKIDGHALFVSGAHETWRIVADVTKLFRPFPADSYLVWIRRHDAGHLSYFMAFPHAIDRDCNAVQVAPADSDTTGIEVRAGEPLEIRCPKERIGRDALLMRVGAWAGSPPRVVYDEAVEVVKPPLGWVAGLPEWTVQGWSEAPDEARETALALLAAAALLAFSRRWRLDGGAIISGSGGEP